MISNVLQDIVVIYHGGNCFDGFSSAWIAHKKFGDNAFYYGLTYQMGIPLWLKDKEVYFIDFCFPEQEMKAVIANNKKVIVIDHHMSQENVIKLAQEYVFDINHCGSVLAWKYFFPEEKMPKFLDYIEDQDIWVWKNDNAKEILAVLEIRDFTFQEWDNFCNDIENEETRKEIIKEGQSILKYQQILTDQLVKNADLAEFQGEKVFVVNTPILVSEIGHALTKLGAKIGITWNQVGNNIKVSMRGDGTIDLSEIAKKFGGGGHHNASGFSFKDDQNAPWDLIQKM